MDYAAILSQFEKACEDLQVPATRAKADQILTSFRQAPQILPACRYILDNTQNPATQFQVALAVKESVIREFTLYSSGEILNLRNYLLNYLLERPDLQRYVREQLLRVIALVIKRSWLSASDEEKSSALLNVQQLSALNNRQGPILSIALANALVDEFGSTKASKVGLSWEFHYKCKVSFENHVLLPLFSQTLNNLHACLQILRTLPVSNLEKTDKTLLSESLGVAEKILNWDFDSLGEMKGSNNLSIWNLQTSADEDMNGLIKRTAVFPKSWRGVIGNREILWIFFSLYTAARDFGPMTHRCRQCLIQLASLKTDIFDTDQGIREYTSALMNGLLALMHDLSVNPPDDESTDDFGPSLLGITQMAGRLLQNIPLRILCYEQQFFQFLSELFKLTTTCLRDTANEIEDSWSMEGLDECLECWVKLVDDTRSLAVPTISSSLDVANLTQFLSNISYQVVETYIDTRMDLAKFEIEHQEDDFEDSGGIKDWIVFEDQLISIACLGRLDSSKTMAKLCGLLQDRIERVKQFFASTEEIEGGKYLDFLNEHLHWLVLISGHVLADKGESEKPLIPEPVMKASFTLQDVEDYCVTLSRLVLELVDYLSQWGVNTIEASYCSPRVAGTLFWFVERWSKTYLLLDESDYSLVSPNIAKAFGRPSPSEGEGFHVLDFILNLIQRNFVLWNADVDVLEQIVNLLNAFSKSPSLREGVLQSERFPFLINFFTENLSQLPESIHNSLIQIITTIATGASSSDTRNRYLGVITNVVENRLASVLYRPDFNKTYQNGEVISNVQNALEMFDGLALATDTINTEGLLNFCSRFFDSFAELIGTVYKDVPEVQILVVQFMADFVRCLDFTQLSSVQKQTIYNGVAHILKAYASANLGKVSSFARKEEEEEPYADISTVLELLSNVMASEFEGFVQEHPPSKPVDGPDAGDIVFFGVDIVIPMITLEMMKFPRLCALYIKLIGNLVEFFPEKLVQLPKNLFNNLMAGLEYGIDQDIADVTRSTTQAIAPLALWYFNEGSTRGHEAVKILDEPLNKFLQNILELLVFKDFASELIEAMGESLMVLICARREFYHSLVNHLLSQQPAELRPRLTAAFERLEQFVPRTLPKVMLSTKEVVGFREHLVGFLMEVRGMLRLR